MELGTSNSAYLGQIVNKLGYVLSSIDRNKTSLTYGCGDRRFWCWKFIDFPGARFQEYLFVLAWLIVYDDSMNRFLGSKLFIEQVSAGLIFWESIQHSDGSYDEAYPNEKSLAATAFTLFYISEAYKLVSHLLNQSAIRAYHKAAISAAEWLCGNNEYHGILSNHLAAASAALYNTGLILGNQKYISKSQFFLNIIYSHQSEEGWYKEYSGPDPGYQSHCTFYLARIYQLSKDPTLLRSLQKANKYFSYFIHPDGSIGGEYSSRNTMFYYPAGYEMLASRCQYAHAIAHHQRKTIYNMSGVGLSQMDEFNVYPLLNNYIFAHNSYLEDSSISHLVTQNCSYTLPYKTEFATTFVEAGIYLHSTPHYYAIVGAKKGGVLRVFDKQTRQIIFQSCGYVERRRDGLYSSQGSCYGELTVVGNQVFVRASFKKIKRIVLNPWLFLLFRFYNLSLSRSKVFARLFKNVLVKKLVILDKSSGTELNRSLIFNDKEIILCDKIIGQSCQKYDHIDKFTSFHMGSSGYADVNEEIQRVTFAASPPPVDKNGIISRLEIKIK